MNLYSNFFCAKQTVHDMSTQSSFKKICDLKYNESNKTTCGLFHHIGTNQNTSSYSNPYKTKQIDITSSPLKDPCDISSLIDLQRPVQYCISKVVQTNNAFFIINLKDKYLNPDYYLMRNYSNGAGWWNKTWNLEGSNDAGKTWVIIDQQKENHKLQGKGKTVTFKVNEHCNILFNLFRVSSIILSDSSYQFALSGFELYGTLYEKIGNSQATNMEYIYQSLQEMQSNIQQLSKQMNALQAFITEEKKNDEIGDIKKEMEIIKQNVNKLMNEKNINNKKVSNDQEEVKKWMTDIVKLPQYIDLFLEQGFESLDIIKCIKMDDLTSIGMDKRGHNIKILKEIAKLNQQNSANEGNTLFV